jgi:hypothetical protein
MSWPFLASDPVKISPVKHCHSTAHLTFFCSFSFPYFQRRPCETKAALSGHTGCAAPDSCSARKVLLKEEISPRFPAGCSMEDVNRHQWMGDGQIINEPSGELFITEERDRPVSSVYHAITAEYIKWFHQQRVLKPERPTQIECECSK